VRKRKENAERGRRREKGLKSQKTVLVFRRHGMKEKVCPI